MKSHIKQYSNKWMEWTTQKMNYKSTSLHIEERLGSQIKADKFTKDCE